LISDLSNILTRFFQDLDFIFVLQTGFGSGSGFLPPGSGQESDSKKLERVRTPLVSTGFTFHFLCQCSF